MLCKPLARTRCVAIKAPQRRRSPSWDKLLLKKHIAHRRMRLVLALQRYAFRKSVECCLFHTSARDTGSSKKFPHLERLLCSAVWNLLSTRRLELGNLICFGLRQAQSAVRTSEARLRHQPLGEWTAAIVAPRRRRHIATVETA